MQQRKEKLNAIWEMKEISQYHTSQHANSLKLLEVLFGKYNV